MKTKKVITLLALLLAGLFVSAQTYSGYQSIVIDKAELYESTFQNTAQRLSAQHHGYSSWAEFASMFPDPAKYVPLGDKDKLDGQTSSYVLYFEENGEVKIQVVDENPLPRRYHPVGTPENGRKPIVP